ncbi:MAG: hypothetical protein IH892_21050, partial [Planctomycetes bacterium]|nr:hypothetical protein [Planctomycetota bacterium]
MKSKMILLAFVLAFGGVAQAQTTHIILAEDFEGLPLGESPEEAAGTPDVWTDTPPPGWFNDESGVPGVGTAVDGVTDWAGWAFTNKDWWVQIAGDQRRSEFTLGQGTVAVADPDEWDDSGTPGNIADDPYDTWLSTRPIELGTSKAGTAQLRFDSSWRPEFDGNYHQTANLTVSFDGADPIELFLWESDSSSPNYKDDNSTNETIVINLDNPPGATSMVLTFGLFEAGNDWWWAVDNIVVTAVRSAQRAFNPNPRQGTEDVGRRTVLSWTPGAYVGGLSPQHRVILSANLAAVEDGTAVVATQDASSFDATKLIDFSTTYYWRIDEANSTSGWDEGSIWQFTVEPIAIAIPNETITATASSTFGVSGPEKTIDGSGLVDDLHNVDAAKMWISAGVPATIEYAFDRAYRLYELWIWNSNQLIETFVGFGAKDVVIEYSVDGANWTVLDGVGPLAQATGNEGYAHN